MGAAFATLRISLNAIAFFSFFQGPNPPRNNERHENLHAERSFTNNSNNNNNNYLKLGDVPSLPNKGSH